jgi:hypothetical protein
VKNNTTYLLALFLVFSALMGGGSPRPGGGGRAGSQPNQPLNKPSSEPFQFSPCVVDDSDDPLTQCKKCPLFCPAKGLLDTVETSLSGSQKNHPQAAQETDFWGVPADQRSKIDFVIATLPDPVHTHLNLVFDRNIEAIQKGAQASGQGYLFSRAWMPWNEQPSPETTDFRLREQEDVLQERKEELPGILIFRREQCSQEERDAEATAVYCAAMDKAPRFLFVLVVGETPTGGVHREQFQNAMKMIRAMRPASADTGIPEQTKILKVLGTTFSGSLNSLADLLNSTEFPGFEHVEIESGTTTDLKSIQRFGEELKKLDAKYLQGEKNPQKGKTSFTRFVPMQESGDYGYERLMEYLHTLGFRRKDIALLSEDETAYGRINLEVQEVETDKKEGSTPKFYFPRDIAQLRASYQHDTQNRSADAKQAPRSSLPLNLDVTGSDDDSVHSYANLQTPLSQEAILKGIVSNLQKHHSKFVIVRATNVLDSLFLCQYLRSAYPDAGLITFESDLLFQQDPDDEKLRGVLSVTTYPLVPGIDEDTTATREHADQVFPDSYSAGVFNATVSLLSTKSTTPKERLEKPWAGGSYASYEWPNLHQVDRTKLRHRPALWLTEMGKGGYWPIALLDESRPAPSDRLKEQAQNGDSILLERAPEAPSAHEPVHPGGLGFGDMWKILWWVTFLVIGIYVFMMIWPPKYPRSELGIVFALPGDKMQNIFLFLGGLILVGALLCFIYPWSIGASLPDDLTWLVLPLVSMAGLALAGYRGLRHRGSERLGEVFGGITAVFLVMAIYGVTFGFCGEPSSREIFFARRFTHIESGLSAAGPLYFLLAGFLWCLWYAIDGVQFSDPELQLLPRQAVYSEQAIPELLLRRKLIPLTQENENTRHLFDLLRPLCKDPWAYVPGVFLILALMLILKFRLPIVILEQHGYVLLVSILLAFGLYLLISLYARLVLVWLECKNFLQRLENLKLRRSFRMQDDFEWGTLWRMASDAGVLNVYQLVSREMECLEEFLKFRIEFEEGGAAQGRSLEISARIKLAYCHAAEAAKHARDVLRGAIQYYSGVNDPRGHKTITTRASESREMLNYTRNFHGAASDTIGKILVLLTLEWEQEPPLACGVDTTKEEAGENKDKDAKKKKDPSSEPPKRPELACAERCVCLYFLIIMLIPLRRIRSLVFGISGLYVFLLLALTSFHFEPHLTIRTGMIALFLGALGCISYVYSQIYRNKTLSRITQTPEDSLGWDFWGRMAGFVAVPVLSLLAAQFPELNRFLFSWLEPALQSFH